MYRLVIYSTPVARGEQTLYGRLCQGQTEEDILDRTKDEYNNLLLCSLWETDAGIGFRFRENWRQMDGGWIFDNDDHKYTWELGQEYPDQFAEEQKITDKVALISGWYPLKFADTDREGFLVNEATYDSLIDSVGLEWSLVIDRDESLPF